MKNIIKIFFASLCALVFASCDPQGQGGEQEPVLNENIKLTVTVMKVEGVNVNIRIESNGADTDTYYGFLTTEADVMKAYSKKVEELAKLEKIEGLSNKPSQVIQLKDLDPVTKYTYIVFGITEKGDVYGMPASAQFTTERKKVEMIENPDWTIEYSGPGTVLEKEYKHTATVTSTDDNMYFVTSYSKALYELYDLADLAASDAESFRAFVEEIQKENPDMTYADGLYKGTFTEGLNIVPGEWYAVAVGITEKGELSGLYAVSDLIEIPKETPTPEYSAWIGKWTWTGANGKTATVEFVEDNPNYTYLMYGWDGYGLDKAETDPFIIVDWSQEDNTWFIYPSYIATAEFTMGDGSSAIGEMYIMGTYEPVEGEKYFHGFVNPICAGSTDENGTKYTIGYAGTDEEGNDYTITMMEYIAFIEVGGEFGASPATSTELPTFPAVITEAVEEGEGEDGEGTAPTSLRKAANRTPVLSKMSQPKNLKANVSIR